MKLIKLLLVLLLGLLTVNGCRQGNVNSWRSNNTAEIDSVDIIVAQRAEEEFNSTIFAGLHFGDNHRVVEKALKSSKNRKIYVSDGERVDSIFVRDFDAVYYKDKLASLVLYANEDRAVELLYELYSRKYGETKPPYEWVFSNCEITIHRIDRVIAIEDKIHDYLHKQHYYYDSYRGTVTKAITKEPIFIKISYMYFPLLNAIQQEENEALEQQRKKENEELMKKREKEMELARKISTEEPTNI